MTKFFLAALLVIGLFITYQCVRTMRYIRIGRAIEQKTIPFSRSVESPQLRILVIGDSSAVGVGAGAPEESVAGRLGAFYPDAEIVNDGVSGARTAELIPRLAARAGQHFDLVLLQIGGNDIVRLTDVDELAKSIEGVLDGAVAISDHVVLVSCGNVGTAKLFPPGVRAIHERRTRVVRELFMRTANEKRVPYIDLFREAYADPFAREPKRFYAADWFHPSGEGYGDWFGFIERALPDLAK
ncbi:MAG: GDSL-type esterase/lipase family protein [Patescibacteria group bacterium]|jgi:lysophospholipase L1-like esterase